MFFPWLLGTGFTLSPAHWNGTAEVLFSIVAVCLIALLCQSLHDRRTIVNDRTDKIQPRDVVIFLRSCMMSFLQRHIGNCLIVRVRQKHPPAIRRAGQKTGPSRYRQHSCKTASGVFIQGTITAGRKQPTGVLTVRFETGRAGIRHIVIIFLAC